VKGLTSVITVNFNTGPILLRGVGAVLASRAPVELILVDNASSDDSLERVRAQLSAEPRLTILENSKNLGFARACNQGIARAAGEYLLLLNPDATVEAGSIALMRDVMDMHPEAGMAGPLLLNPDGSEQAGGRRGRPTPGHAFVRAFGISRLLKNRSSSPQDFVRRLGPIPEHTVEVNAISGAFMFVRRTAINTVGHLDEGYFLHCEDLDWCERFRLAGLRVLFVPAVKVLHDKGVSSRDRPVRVLWHAHRGMIRYYRKFFRQEYPLPLLWLVFAGVWLRFSALAAMALVRRVRLRAAAAVDAGAGARGRVARVPWER
jgi:GT2 family glycosyltransferase